MEEMGTCLLEKTALNYNDDESGELFAKFISTIDRKLIGQQLFLGVPCNKGQPGACSSCLRRV
jgi:hypothetical protein